MEPPYQYPSCFYLCSFCFWGKYSNSWYFNDIRRNCLLGHRKKIAKFFNEYFSLPLYLPLCFIDLFLLLCSVAEPGCLSRIPDPTFFHPGSRIRTVSIPDPHQRILSILTPKKAKKWFLSSKKYDPGCSSRILDPGSGCWLSPIPDPGSRGQKGTQSRIPDLDPQHCSCTCLGTTIPGCSPASASWNPSSRAPSRRTWRPSTRRRSGGATRRRRSGEPRRRGNERRTRWSNDTRQVAVNI